MVASAGSDSNIGLLNACHVCLFVCVCVVVMNVADLHFSLRVSSVVDANRIFKCE